MAYRFRWLSAIAVLAATGTSFCAGGLLAMSQQVPAQQAFPDVPPDYWASPFIQTLAEEGIIVGYLDGTFKPEQPVDRDEFAAMLRQAFERGKVREIESGSVFKDVPDGYWASRPIKEAYESGFMNAFSGNLFRPQEEMPRVRALVSLSEGLNLAYDPSAAATGRTPATPAIARRPERRRISKNRFAFPLAMTAMIPPTLVQPPRNPISQSPAATTAQNAPSELPASEFLEAYYADADRIPQEAVDEVAAATQANLVVNHPDVRFLNPNTALKRGTAAAIIYQALARQGRIKPIASSVPAAQYVVGGTEPSHPSARSAQ